MDEVALLKRKLVRLFTETVILEEELRQLIAKREADRG